MSAPVLVLDLVTADGTVDRLTAYRFAVDSRDTLLLVVQFPP